MEKGENSGHQHFQISRAPPMTVYGSPIVFALSVGLSVCLADSSFKFHAFITLINISYKFEVTLSATLAFQDDQQNGHSLKFSDTQKLSFIFAI